MYNLQYVTYSVMGRYYVYATVAMGGTQSRIRVLTI